MRGTFSNSETLYRKRGEARVGSSLLHHVIPALAAVSRPPSVPPAWPGGYPSDLAEGFYLGLLFPLPADSLRPLAALFFSHAVRPPFLASRLPLSMHGKPLWVADKLFHRDREYNRIIHDAPPPSTLSRKQVPLSGYGA